MDSKIDSDTIIACPKLDLEDELITKIDTDDVGDDYDEKPFYYYDPDYADYSDYVIDIDTRRENFKSLECFKNAGTRLINKSQKKRCALDVTHGPVVFRARQVHFLFQIHLRYAYVIYP